MTARLQATPETWVFLAMGLVAMVLAQQDLVSLSHPALTLLLGIAVALTGLPHGALDPWVAWRAGLWRTRGGFVAFHLAYVAIAVGVIVTWKFAPGASLAFFLAISAWHFGGDWQPALPPWARAVSGLALLALPALAAPAEVSAIFAILAGPQGQALASALGMAAPWLALAAAASALLALRRSPAATLELGAVGALALLLPPLVFFLVYFCALHSPRHLRLAAVASAPGQRHRIVGVALGYTLLTLLAAGLAWPWLAGDVAAAAVETSIVRVVFIGLAALTLPHMIVVMLAEQRAGSLP